MLHFTKFGQHQFWWGYGDWAQQAYSLDFQWIDSDGQACSRGCAPGCVNTATPLLISFEIICGSFMSGKQQYGPKQAAFPCHCGRLQPLYIDSSTFEKPLGK